MNTTNLAREEVERIAIDFLKGKKSDHRGLKIADYLNMSEERMELDHQWIQWAFPINKFGPHNQECGLLFPESRRFFKYGSKLVETQNALLQKYMDSIGFYAEDFIGYNVDENKFFSVVDSKHNHHVKRISRVLKHFALTGSEYQTWNIMDDLCKLIQKYPDSFDSYSVCVWFTSSYLPVYAWD